LIQFQARRTEDPGVREALREVLDRVGAVSTVHRRLFQGGDPARFELAEFLRDIVDDQLGRAGRSDVEVRFALEPVNAPAASAAPLALLVNEILGRALSVGMPPPGGRLSVELRAVKGAVRIHLAHEGPTTADVLRNSLNGPSGIAAILTRQLRAEIEWRDNQPGAAALITLPMERGE
jgi:two-component sensor histidine kinase